MLPARLVCLLSLVTVSLAGCARGPCCRNYYVGWTPGELHETSSFPYRRELRLMEVRQARLEGRITAEQERALADCRLTPGMPDWAFWLAVGQPDWELVSMAPTANGMVEYRIQAVAGGLQGPHGWMRDASLSPTKPGIRGETLSDRDDCWARRNDVLRVVFREGRLVGHTPPYVPRAREPLWAY